MKKSMSAAVITVLLVITAIAIVFPLIVILTNSFMGAEEINKAYGNLFAEKGEIDLHLIPQMFTVFQYYRVLLSSPRFYDLFLNGVLLSLPILIGSVVIGTVTGYGLARYHFPGRKLILYLYILGMLLPYQVLLIPNFVLINRMGLLGSRWAVILIGIFSPFGTYLMYRFAEKLEESQMEAAALDGASSLRTFFSIALPQLKAGIASLVVFNLIDTWNMVEQPMIILQEESKYPISLALAQISRQEIETIFVYSLVSMLPILWLFFKLRRYLISGIETSIIKE